MSVANWELNRFPEKSIKGAVDPWALVCIVGVGWFAPVCIPIIRACSTKGDFMTARTDRIFLKAPESSSRELAHVPTSRLPLQNQIWLWLCFFGSLALFVASVFFLPVIEVRGTTGIESVDGLLRHLGGQLDQSKTLSSALLALWEHRSSTSNLVLLVLLSIPLVLATLKYIVLGLNLIFDCKSLYSAIALKALKPQALVSLLEVFICAVTVLSFFGINFVIVQLNVSPGVGVVTYLVSIVLGVFVGVPISRKISSQHAHLNEQWYQIRRAIVSRAISPRAAVVYCAALAFFVILWNLPLWLLRPCRHLEDQSKSLNVDCSQCGPDCVKYIVLGKMEFNSLVVPNSFTNEDLESILKRRGGVLTSVTLLDGRLNMRNSLHLIAKYCPNLVTLRLPGAKLVEIDLVLLRPLRRLEEIDFDGASLNERGLFHLDGFQHLRRLNLANTKIQSEGLYYLSKLGGLRELAIDASQLDDNGWVTLSGLSEVTDIAFADSSVLPRQKLLFLAPMRSLKRIKFASNPLDLTQLNESRASLNLAPVTLGFASAKK